MRAMWLIHFRPAVKPGDLVVFTHAVPIASKNPCGEITTEQVHGIFLGTRTIHQQGSITERMVLMGDSGIREFVWDAILQGAIASRLSDALG